MLTYLRENKLKIAFFCVLLFGLITRIIWVTDMEWKEDEQIMFNWVQDALNGKPWPTLGMGSGVYFKNPGLSVWLFMILGWVFDTRTPPGLCRIVMISNMISLLLFCWIGIRHLKNHPHKEAWFWAIALSAVNPITMSYERKIWAQSILPVFSAIFLMVWLRRHSRWGAFFWGLVGAIIGQVHMSGFPFALAVVLWCAFFDRNVRGERPPIPWKYWFWGSVVGSIPILNWFYYLITQFPKETMEHHGGLNETVQLRYWVFWFTDPLGLHLGNLLGVKNGNKLWEQIGEFCRYPLEAGGEPTWIMAYVHLILVLTGATVFLSALRALGSRVRDQVHSWGRFLKGSDSDFAFLQAACFFAYGALLTLPGFLVFRFYMIITIPFAFFFLSRTALMRPQFGRWCLGILVAGQLVMSMTFLSFIHQNAGAPRGSYGQTYETQVRPR